MATNIDDAKKAAEDAYKRATKALEEAQKIISQLKGTEPRAQDAKAAGRREEMSAEHMNAGGVGDAGRTTAPVSIET